MDNMYGFWSFGENNRLGHTEIQEDQSWKVAASKLAFADQMRIKFDRSRSDVKAVIPHEKNNNKPAKGRSKARVEELLKGEGYNQKHADGELRYGEMGQKLGALNTASSQTVNSVDKRFKSLPASETLPRHETLGGYIFVCNNDTMAEDLKRQLFGLPQRYRDSVRAIQPGLPLFLYNYTTHQLHGVYEAASFGGSNIDPTAWEDKKCKGESRFPAQVRIRVRKLAKPLEEDSFRPVLYHYDGPKFRLQLSVPETLALLDLFDEAGAL
ncbi:hypothetical protein KP509_35G024600 [Ceratopteris richardii]|uniref:DCD domain-containing protein n=1 Tax=Ceratopteris richardii TaxID=49495 RepID=A0A8T2QF98_CERRI|nr:hypothetical protein KP509_35G024600 [Ceratopteris richardii]